MEISERELRGLTAAVDEQHRDGMVTLAGDLRELHAATRALRPSRRDLFRRAGKTAGALTIGTAIIPFASIWPAAAQEETQEITDEDIAAFAETIELTAIEAYREAAASGLLSPPVAQAAAMFAGHHTEHANALKAPAGAKATGKPNGRLLASVSDQLKNATTERGILQIAYDLENSAAGTYLYALGVLKASSALRLAASILPVESQHAVVLGQALGKPADQVVPSFENQDRGIDPAKFPTSTTTAPNTTTTTK